jgi:hypothetical protein
VDASRRQLAYLIRSVSTDGLNAIGDRHYQRDAVITLVFDDLPRT